MRVQILSLSLRPEGRVALDRSVERLFVEYSLLDLPTEETPLSLPKPRPGMSINYNYSKGRRRLISHHAHFLPFSRAHHAHFLPFSDARVPQPPYLVN